MLSLIRGQTSVGRSVYRVATIAVRNASGGPEIDKKQALYGDYHYRESIERGRQSYTKANVLTALGLSGLVAGIYFYSLKAVRQEDYSDIPMPPEPSAEQKSKYESADK
ncbi:hypothetical protein GGH91_000388 [Coemansia sp. RSA 2671]|uniref:Cytochrome c oxidase assembly factor 3 n=2 Tax=Coemansia TaxID=4863 RepID=A0A9W8L2H4_9FUNG|nr:hypothetical protein LPJ60_003267 [Coemansia sp. RSA 2675]KAJ2350062.1 hypothetical protein GGH91_000388 [Coemansia sp. RSA 2671]KAJ2355249.1 hypothetical protein H4S02_012980 [Coemansia sp. RSA 2611]KAJ2413566.1 hypothetical protein GGI10_002972 [Coemansia sp. RSA 2530]KAJ2683670.1 hypothetical protein IWW39_005369 [Coemansia spiralis]KAJ2698765.1 hypothetical protein H4218_003086 [Coemansia sp. IMI 209128]KAJ2772181.1 hypothetical protein GGI18_004909 [Coemansia linderi]